MIKASEGGGGKGIRKASNDDEFTNFLRQVSLKVWLLITIRPVARKGYGSIAHEAKPNGLLIHGL